MANASRLAEAVSSCDLVRSTRSTWSYSVFRTSLGMTELPSAPLIILFLTSQFPTPSVKANIAMSPVNIISHIVMWVLGLVPNNELPASYHWQSAHRFLYSLLLGANMNFWMVCKKVSSEANNPTLSPGWSYYCKVKKYMEHLATGVEREEVRICCCSVTNWCLTQS